MKNASAVPSSPKRTPLVVWRKIADLKPDRKNTRDHSPKQIGQIAASIETFGFNVPVLIDRYEKIIAGHGRTLAAQQLGWTEIPTICLQHLTPTQIRAFMIADNRLTENSTWNDRLLAEQLKELSVLDLDFSIEITGFAMGEIDLRIQGLESANGDADPADVLPVGESTVPVTRKGDLWMCGVHRILCADALERHSYDELMGKGKATTVIADPPYNVPIDGNVSGLGKTHHRPFAMGSGEWNVAEFTDFLNRVFVLQVSFSIKGGIAFVFMDWRHMREILNAGYSVYGELKNLCVWAKNNGGMGSLYRSRHELIFVFKAGTDRHRNNVQLGQFGRNRTNVWEYPGANSFSRSGTEGNLLESHPTPKPVAMIADAILDCSARGDIVLDNFLGSGTTVIAAERTGRRCYGLEIDPLFVDTIIRRWQLYTGQDARLGANSRTFNEIEAERRE